MPTARSQLAALHHNIIGMFSSYLLAIGGWDGDHWIEQLFNQWHTVTALPRPLRRVSAVIHVKMCLYIAATDGSLYSCTLQSFLLPKQKWKQCPCPIPLWDSTVTSVCSELIAIGVASVNMEAQSDVYQFFENTWTLCGSLYKARWNCLVAVLPRKNVIIVGGGTAVESDIIDTLLREITCLRSFSLPSQCPIAKQSVSGWLFRCHGGDQLR